MHAWACVSDVGVLGQFGGAEWEACVGGRRDVRVRREQGFEGGRRVQCGRGKQAWVDAHADALRHQTVGRLQHGPWGGQQVGDGGGRRVGEKGGRGWRRRSLGRVGGAGVREGVAVHRGRDEGLRTARLGVVAVPFVVTGAVVLDLRGHDMTDAVKNWKSSKLNNQNQIYRFYTDILSIFL